MPTRKNTTKTNTAAEIVPEAVKGVVEDAPESLDLQAVRNGEVYIVLNGKLMPSNVDPATFDTVLETALGKDWLIDRQRWPILHRLIILEAAIAAKRITVVTANKGTIPSALLILDEDGVPDKDAA